MGFTVFGGQLRPEISLSIEGKLPVSDEQVQSNVEHFKTLDLPSYRDLNATGRRLAVVGGGPSIADHVETLRNWDGDVWSINGAWAWCKDRGIESTFFAVDPHPIVAQWADKRISTAVLETRIDPSVFEALKDADVYTFDIGGAKGQIASGGSAVTSIPHLACRIGYVEVTLFGCESSYALGKTHAYMQENRPEQMLIECAGEYYLTAPDFYMQVFELARYIKEVPEFLKEESGGLLRKVVEGNEMHVRWVSDALAADIAQINRPITGAMVMADNLEAFGLTEADVRAA